MNSFAPLPSVRHRAAVVLTLMLPLLPACAPSASSQEDGPTTRSPAPQTPPEVDGRRLAYGSASYRTTFTLEERKMVVNTRRWLERVDAEGEAVIRLREVTESTQGDAEDVTDLNAETLRPVRKRAGQAPAYVEVDYGDRLVTGRIELGQKTIPVRLELDAPAFGDGASLETAILALPLVEGYRTALRSIAIGLQQSVHGWSLTVEDGETVEVPAGSFETLRVELEPQGDTDGGKTLWVSRKTPRLLIQAENRLPAALGGTVTTTVLLAVEPADTSTP